MKIVQKSVRLKPVDVELIKFVMSDKMSWFYQDSACGHGVYSHALKKRRLDELPVEGETNSALYQNFYKIFKRFCEDNDLQVNTVHRAALNSVGYNGFSLCDIHVDHDFPHTNFIMYLNEFSEGHTFIYDDNDNVISEIVPKKGEAVTFPGLKHAHAFPKKGERRVVLVFTFS